MAEIERRLVEGAIAQQLPLVFAIEQEDLERGARTLFGQGHGVALVARRQLQQAFAGIIEEGAAIEHAARQAEQGIGGLEAAAAQFELHQGTQIEAAVRLLRVTEVNTAGQLRLECRQQGIEHHQIPGPVEQGAVGAPEAHRLLVRHLLVVESLPGAVHGDVHAAGEAGRGREGIAVAAVVLSLLAVEIAELQPRAAHAGEQVLAEGGLAVARQHPQAVLRRARHRHIRQSVGVEVAPGGPQDRRGIRLPGGEVRGPMGWRGHAEAKAAIVLQHLHHIAAHEVAAGALATHQQINPAIAVPVAPLGLMDQIEHRQIEAGVETAPALGIDVVDQDLGLAVAEAVEAPMQQVQVGVVVDVAPGHAAFPAAGVGGEQLTVELGHQ